MRRSIRLFVLLATAVAASACADITAPSDMCGVVSGAETRSCS